jgi:hypothetical protein
MIHTQKLGGSRALVCVLLLQSKLCGVQESIKAELQSLEQGLQRRKDAAAARATLELMQEVAASTGKVEKLLSELSSGQTTAATAAAAGAGGGVSNAAGLGAADATSGAAAATGDAGAAAGRDELEERCRMLLRVAGEAARLVFLAERGKVRGVAQAGGGGGRQGGSREEGGRGRWGKAGRKMDVNWGL